MALDHPLERDALARFEHECVAAGDRELTLRTAQVTLERAEKAIAKDPGSAPPLAAGANALALLGEEHRARDWIDRALLLDPDNLSLRYNLACLLTLQLKDFDRALEMMKPYFEQVVSPTFIKHLQADPDLDPLRDDPAQRVGDARVPRRGARHRLHARGHHQRRPHVPVLRLEESTAVEGELDLDADLVAEGVGVGEGVLAAQASGASPSAWTTKPARVRRSTHHAANAMSTVTPASAY